MPEGRHEIVLEGGAGFCNAFRRALISEISTWAPCTVTIRRNTSCQTDEYIAHRIGLIPFRRISASDEVSVHVKGRTVLGSDFNGGFEAVHQNIEVIALGPDSELDATVLFDKQAASTHARYGACAAVGMVKVDNGGRHKISFELHDEKLSAKTIALEALDALEKHVENALQQLATQDGTFKKKSKC